jgi:glucose-1-phosphate cytidylyltransferase
VGRRPDEGWLMKAVILAGGIGSRLSEETTLRPKPMVEIGGKPILWHIMKIYAAYGIQDFVICLGYKGYAIKEYFANYVLHMSDVTIDLEHNKVELHDRTCPHKCPCLELRSLVWPIRGLLAYSGGEVG